MPGPMNPKNFALSPAATDLGLGLSQSLSDELLNEEERRKKVRDGQQNNPANFGDSVLGPAAMSLFPGAGK